ncbi:MAG: LysR family transcriptional regulator [Albidovulum sp.]|nr:LysR family transcriptional regulator [Albidovulum sp.]MDE0303968.1 LysR family transcriptional regulator [Albidovulum sp.]MDE0532476.1 LysR family transcriptional regulator [Albidovulum sp.]
MASPKINIRSLQALIAVYEEQSFSRAAERENATQSGMSTQVKNLEISLGAPLLERRRGSADLTPVGRVVYEDGRRILRALFELERKTEEVKGSVTGKIKFGIIPSLTRSVLPGAMQRFREEYRQIDISVLEEYSFSLMRRVAKGDLDCAVVPAGDVLNGLTAKYLATDHEVLFGATTLLPNRRHLDPVRPEDLDGLKLIMPSPRNIRRRWLDNYFEAHDVKIREVLEMDAMLATLEFVSRTDWCAVLPSVLCHNDIQGERRKLHPLSEPGIATDYIVVQKSEKALSRASAIFLEHLRNEVDRLLAEWKAATLRGKAC